MRFLPSVLPSWVLGAPAWAPPRAEARGRRNCTEVASCLPRRACLGPTLPLLPIGHNWNYQGWNYQGLFPLLPIGHNWNYQGWNYQGLFPLLPIGHNWNYQGWNYQGLLPLLPIGHNWNYQGPELSRPVAPVADWSSQFAILPKESKREESVGDARRHFRDCGFAPFPPH